MALRLVAMLWWFLLGELHALSPARHLAGERRPVRRGLAAPPPLLRAGVTGGSSHLAGIKRLFSACASRSRVWTTRRRAGRGHDAPRQIIDNRCPTRDPTHGIGLRYVIKRELQMIPTIDIGGRWCRRTSSVAPRATPGRVGVAAADRGSAAARGSSSTRRARAPGQDRAREGDRRRAPARDLAPGGATSEPAAPAPRRAARAARGGAGGLVFCGHVGFDGFQHSRTSGRAGWSARIGRFWRSPAAEIPGEAGRAEWLYDWQELDDWVGSKIERSDAEQGRFDSERVSDRVSGEAT